MRYTISYYGHERTARTASGAIRAAKEMERTYGRATRAPVIEAGSSSDAEELMRMQAVADTSYCIKVDGQPVA